MALVNIRPSDPVPIWRQIQNELRRLIATRVLDVGDAVPSVRELAREILVNPATIAKAYRGLVDDGLLEVRRGDGTYVASGVSSVPASERKKGLSEAAVRYASSAATLGAPRDRALDEVTRALDATIPLEEKS